MKELREENAKFVVHHKMTEQNRLKLEKGVRRLGFAAGGQRIVTALLALGALMLALAVFLDGAFRIAAGAMSAAAFLAGAGCLCFLYMGWRQAKASIRRQFAGNAALADVRWEYRFFEDCYEAIGLHERAQVRYSHITRLMDFSGVLALAEKGNVVRYFEKSAVERGKADELAAFLEKKTRIRMERVRV